MTMTDPQAITAQLGLLRERLEQARATNIGFPGAVDFDVAEVLPFFHYLLNNVGDPYIDGVGRAHTKDLERQLIDFYADMFGAPQGDRWGYVTSGGTDGNEYGLFLARSLYPDGLVYYSEAAHYSIPKLVDRLRMPAIVIRAQPDGEMRYRDLASVVRHHRDRPAIIVASVGTTMTEAIDDVSAIGRVLASLAVREHFIHADAALAGIPLALLWRGERPGFDLADGADSLSISGHKFVGCPVPCGVLLTRQTLRTRVGRAIDYIGSIDSTVGGSRSGHAPLLLWYATRRLGVDGLRHRAEQSRTLAAYAVDRLNEIGWPAWRHPHAFTVVLPTPPAAVAQRWMLATSGGLSHIICMPGVTQAQIDAFVTELAAHTGETVPVSESVLPATAPDAVAESASPATVPVPVAESVLPATVPVAVAESVLPATVPVLAPEPALLPVPVLDPVSAPGPIAPPSVPGVPAAEPVSSATVLDLSPESASRAIVPAPRRAWRSALLRRSPTDRSSRSDQ